MGGWRVSFDEFLQANMIALGRYAAVLTGDRHLAEDVLSDALITASARWGDIEQMEFPLAYVRRIVASTFIADRRRHHRRNTTTRSDPAGSIASLGDPHGQLDDRDQLDRLLRTLTPSQRAAVVMRFYLDLPDSDIAEALDCSLSNVRSTIFRALSALRLAQTARKG